MFEFAVIKLIILEFSGDGPKEVSLLDGDSSQADSPSSGLTFFRVGQGVLQGPSEGEDWDGKSYDRQRRKNVVTLWHALMIGELEPILIL